MKFWPFQHKGYLPLSAELRDQLQSQCGVESGAADELRYVTKQGRFGGRSANLVCIFDPATLPGSRLIAHTFKSLMALREGPLFTGHIIATGQGGEHIYLKDLRAS